MLQLRQPSFNTQGLLPLPLSHRAQWVGESKAAIECPQARLFCPGDAMGKKRVKFYNKSTNSLTSESFSKTRLQCTNAKRKQCFDITLSRQEESTMRHLANIQYKTGPADR